MTKSTSKLVSFTTTATFLAGLIIFCFAVTSIRNETVSMLVAFVGAFYFLAYGEIEKFVARLEKEHS